MGRNPIAVPYNCSINRNKRQKNICSDDDKEEPRELLHLCTHQKKETGSAVNGKMLTYREGFQNVGDRTLLYFAPIHRFHNFTSHALPTKSFRAEITRANWPSSAVPLASNVECTSENVASTNFPICQPIAYISRNFTAIFTRIYWR